MNNFTSRISLRNIAIASAIAIFFIADRYLKLLAINGAETNLIGNWLVFSFRANPFIAFSLPFQGPLLTALIAGFSVLLISAVIFLWRRGKHIFEIFFLSALLIGALSNLFDRLAYGYVVDYLYLRHFTIFNLADVMISFSAGILIIRSLRKK